MKIYPKISQIEEYLLRQSNIRKDDMVLEICTKEKDYSFGGNIFINNGKIDEEPEGNVMGIYLTTIDFLTEKLINKIFSNTDIQMNIPSRGSINYAKACAEHYLRVIWHFTNVSFTISKMART